MAATVPPGANVPPGGAAAVALVHFTLAPAFIDNDVIDYASPEGIKLYKANTQPLNRDSAFDCTSKNLYLFLEQV